MAPALGDALRWTAIGTQLCERAIADEPDGALAEPSGLPGWTRAHVVAHLDGNARALVNLVTWARTSVETPMYSSMDQRNADIETGAALPGAELRERFAQSRTALANGMAQLSEQAWAADVVTAQGRTVPASEIPWMRAREVMVHAVDLKGGVAFADLPEDFLTALVSDVVARRAALADQPALVLHAGGHRWDIPGADVPAAIEGSLADIAAYACGRARLGPDQPAWL
jgi:maleylpyruvate isomerase